MSMMIGLAPLTVVGLAVTGRMVVHAADRPDLALAVAAAVARLNVKPHTTELTSEKAARARDAIRHGDYHEARGIVLSVYAASQLESWRFYPFSDFMGQITDVIDPAFEGHLNEWVARDNKDTTALLIRAQYYHDLGWFRRSHRFSRDVTQEAMSAFRDNTGKALTDIETVIASGEGNPFAYYLRLQIMRGMGMRAELVRAFEDGITRYPDYYRLYEIFLEVLQPRWGGSAQAMYAFVDRFAGGVGRSSPRKLLYLSLYRDLQSSAWVDCHASRNNKDAMTRCVTSAAGKTISADLENTVESVLRLYDKSDKYQFGVLIDGILTDILGTPGGDAYAGTIVQLAASAMHSDTQLKEDKPARNNYVIDTAVALSWYSRGFYENAVTKDQEALADLVHTEFPGEEERDRARAGIYARLAGEYSALGQTVEMIAAQKAAVLLGGYAKYGQNICYGNYMIKDYEAAAEECQRTVDAAPANLAARFWLGKAHENLGMPDIALREMTVIADSEHDFRASAAIELSMIYFNRDDVRGALNILNKYTYLYNPNVTSKDNVAVGYNNRCYAYMKLGQLKQALSDCDESLKYGTLPDALRKQRELKKQLGI